ncbi:hypothetical protein PEC302107_33910 [Pectobacterium araliae]|nr:hypothetical protein PEC302107_33910 [Pectobacterium carotovorum subsp. carotovorum]
MTPLIMSDRAFSLVYPFIEHSLYRDWIMNIAHSAMTDADG